MKKHIVRCFLIAGALLAVSTTIGFAQTVTHTATVCRHMWGGGENDGNDW